MIRRFSPGSVAPAAGVLAEDVLIAIDDTQIHDMHDVQSVSALKRPGDHAVLHLLRFNQDIGKAQPVTVELTLPEAGAGQQQLNPSDAALPGG
jgi:S1-C subfamily serine protease